MNITNEELGKAAAAIRVLAADTIEKAKSGHPGAPLGLADVAATLWLRHLNLDPEHPNWALRDRLVFSGGHASSLVYTLFHLSGMGGVTLDEMKSFRQFGSRTAGHPERGMIPGIEVTTGPLGQGIAMGVGLAIGAKMKNVPNRTWIFCGDGDMEEGISHEAASMAGTLKLGALKMIYDSNDIQIEGHASEAMADDTAMRFKAYGWQVFSCDGHDFDSIEQALCNAEAVTDAPALVIAKTVIGKGAPNKQGTSGVHGAPLGTDELKALKAGLGYDPEQSFAIPADVYAIFGRRAAEVRGAVKSFDAAPTHAKPDVKKLLAALPAFDPAKPVATRVANGTVMNALAAAFPELVGGSADLEPSNKTAIKSAGWISAQDFSGRNFHWGVRELAMAAVVNGLTAYADLRGFGATFFVFSEYCKPAIRVASIMELPSLFVFSHDSFHVGEDGPTHEPIEQLAALRATPNLTEWRPADANETGYAWVEMLAETKGPSCILTTRQNLPILKGTSHAGLARGAYVIAEFIDVASDPAKALLFVASGSEVSLAVAAAEKIAATGRAVRVVSMPSMSRFFAQDADYRNAVLPPAMTDRVIVEAACRFGLQALAVDPAKTRYVTLDHYGASGNEKKLAEEYGFTVENLVAAAS